MEVIKYFLQLMSIFKYNFYSNYTKVCGFAQVRSIATAITISVLIKEYSWKALGMIIVLLDMYCLNLLVPKLNSLPNGVCFNLSNFSVSMSIYDIFKLILSILSLHLCLKYFMYRSEWERFKWLENFIIVGSYIGVFIIVLILGCIGLVIVLNATFEKIIFLILLVITYFAYYTVCTTDWFDKYILYSTCYTYTSTVNHLILKDRKYLIVTNLATRWKTKKVKKITKKNEKTVPSTPQDPRLNRQILINKGLNDNDNRFTSLKTSQSLDGEDEYLKSTRIVSPDTYYDQLDTAAWGKSELNEYPNKLLQYKLIPM